MIYSFFPSHYVARVAQSEAKICAGKECLLCKPRARHLKAWGSDHVERSPTPTHYSRFCDCALSVTLFFIARWALAGGGLIRGLREFDYSLRSESGLASCDSPDLMIPRPVKDGT